MLNRMKWLVYILLVLVTTPNIRGEDVTITVAADQPGWTISKYLTGMHTVYGQEPDALWESPKLAQWMKEAKVGIIRYPGGTAVQHWHWDAPNGISFNTDSWDPDYRDRARDPELWMDLDEFMVFCRKIGAEPMVGINTRSGKKYKRREDSLESARRLIQHCRNQKYGVKFWYIGNECFIGWSAMAYARDIDDYARVLKSVDPDITIVGDWKFGPEAKNRFSQAMEIATLSKELDILEIHEKYALGPDGWGLRRDGYTSKTSAGWQQEAGLYHGRLDHYIESFLANTEQRDRPVKLAFNEWAAMNADPYLSALTKGDYLISMFKYPVFSACDWTVHWGKGAPILFNKKSHKVTLQPAAEVFTLLSDALGQRHLPMSSSHNTVYGFAAQQTQTDTILVYVLNKLSSNTSIELDLGTSTGTADLLLTVTSLVNPGKLIPSPPVTVTSGTAPRAVLPPLSFNRIKVNKK